MPCAVLSAPDEPVWAPCVCTCSPQTCRRKPSCRSSVWTCTPSSAHCCPLVSCLRRAWSSSPVAAAPNLSGTFWSVSSSWGPNKTMTTRWVKLGDRRKSLLITSHINGGASHLQGKFAQISRLWQKKSYFHLRWLYDSLVIDSIHSKNTQCYANFFCRNSRVKFERTVPLNKYILNPCTANSPVSELDRESNHSGKCGSIRAAEAAVVIFPYSALTLHSHNNFVQVRKFINMCNYSPHLNESFKCVLTTKGYRWAGGGGGLKPWSIFFFFAFRAPLKRHDSEANFKSKKLLETNEKSLPDRIPNREIWAENSLMCTYFHQQREVLWSWDGDPTQLEKKPRESGILVTSRAAELS